VRSGPSQCSAAPTSCRARRPDGTSQSLRGLAGLFGAAKAQKKLDSTLVGGKRIVLVGIEGALFSRLRSSQLRIMRKLLGDLPLFGDC